jgi:two-component system phosphate regulon response regulator OmpR
MTDRVLVIDDDESLAAMVAEYLSSHGMEVDHAAHPSDGLAVLLSGGFDAIVLDVMLPDIDGFEMVSRIRAESDIPILMLTARGEETDRIVGLELGADDYLPKPFNPRELLARLKALIRRQRRAVTASDRLLRLGGLEIDLEQRRVRLDGVDRDVTSHQFDLLVALAENRGRVMSRDELMHRVRGTDLERFDRSIDVHISRIRAAIEEDPKHPRRILTVRGAGYLFTSADETP